MKPFGWYIDTMLRDELLNVHNVTIICEIDVIEIYDREHQIVTDYYAYIEQDGFDYDMDEEFVVDDMDGLCWYRLLVMVMVGRRRRRCVCDWR